MRPAPPQSPVDGHIGFAIDGANRIAGRIAQILGLEKAPGHIEKQVQEIKEFVDRQIDSILGGIAAAARAVADEGHQRLKSAEEHIEGESARVEFANEQILAEFGDSQKQAMEVAKTGEKVAQKTRRRSNSIRKWANRIRDRATFIEHPTQVVLLGFEGELEELAHEIQITGESAAAIGKGLIRQIELESGAITHRLASEVHRNLASARSQADQVRLKGQSLAAWAAGHVQRVEGFRAKQSTPLGKIQTIAQIQDWAGDTIASARAVADDIGADVRKKPSEIVSFGQQKVSDAMALLRSAKDGSFLAGERLREQRSMRSNAWQGLDQTREKGHVLIQLLGASMTGAKAAIAPDPPGRAVIGDLDPKEPEVELKDMRPMDAFYESKLQNSIPSLEEPKDLDQQWQFDLPNDPPAPVAIPTKPSLPHATVNPPQKAKRNVSNRPPDPAPSLPAVRSSVGSTRSVAPKPTAPFVAPPKVNTSVESSPATSAPAQGGPSVSTTAITASVGRSPEGVADKPNIPHIPRVSAEPQKSSKREVTPPSLDIPKPKAVDLETKKSRPTPSRSQANKPIAQPEANQGPSLQRTAAPSPGQGPPRQPASTLIKPTLEDSVKPASPKRNAGAPPSDEDMSLAPSLPSPALQEDPTGFRQQLLQHEGAGALPTADMAARMAPHLDFDISIARLHTGPWAAAAARLAKADAFTIGRDIFFGANKFDPVSPHGLGLIAHELTHVGQQLGMRDKMRFATKAGGDAMEQEAQEVGERVTTSLSHRAGLQIGNYAREYSPADDEPLTHGAKQRLDQLGMRALSLAGDLLKGKLGSKPLRLDLVSVELTIDLESSSDQEIIAVWAEAICSAILGAQAIRSQAHLRSEKQASSPIIQRRFGNDAEIGHYAKQQQVIDAIDAKLSKISATPEDKDLIRSLYVRKLLDKPIKAAKKSRGSFSITDLASLTGVSVGNLKNLKTLSFGDEEAAVLAAMKEFGFESAFEYELAEKKLIQTFVAKGIASTHYMLDENLRIIDQEIMHYWGSGSKPRPNDEYKRLKEAAIELNQLFKEFAERYDHMAEVENSYKKYRVRDYKHLPKASFQNMPHIINILSPIYFQRGQVEILTPLWEKWNAAKIKHGKKFPILLGNFDHAKIADAVDDTKVIGEFMDHLWPIKYDIEKVKSKLDADKFWELPKMIELTKKNLGILPGDGADIVLSEYAQDKRDDEAMWSMIKAAATIALAIVTTVATGGLAAVAMVGSAALSVHSAYTSVEAYQFKTAAMNTALEEAKRISKDDPSLFWVVLDVLGAALDVGAAVMAFNTLSKAARTARAAQNAAKKAAKGEADAISELHDAAKAVYKENPSLHKMTEEEFVARVFESANRGLDVAESVTKQYRVVSELLQGTSRRVVGIMQGERHAIAGVIKEHGNWKGLLSALDQGGEDARKIANQIHLYREEVVGKLKEVGIRPLDSASAGPLSDYDLSVFGDDVMGAGEKLITYEKQMRDTFGDGWNAALDINFYTPGNQLRAYEGAMLHASGPEQARILARVTERAELLNLAKMVEHAGDDLAALERVKEYIKALGKDYKIEDLRKVGKDLHGYGRNKALIVIDEKVKQLKSVPPGSRRYQQLSEEITMRQMEANFLMNEAYIGPASIKGGTWSGGEIHQIAVSQLYMIEHVISMYSGDILKAVRNYEFHKYVSRYVKAAKQAGISSEALTDFERLSGFVYREAKNRSALQFTGQYPGVTPANDVVGSAVNANYIKKQYDEFMKEVQSSLPKIQKNAKSPKGGAWEDQFPKAGGGTPDGGAPGGGPPGGTPPGGPGGSGSGGPPTPPTPPPGPPSGHPPLPPIPPIPQHIVDRLPRRNIRVQSINKSNKLSSAGFKGSAADDIGVFRGRVEGVDGPVVIKLYDARDADTMLKEYGAAKAAERTGYGPTIYGQVTDQDGIGFAMEEIHGGFADDFEATLDPAQDAVNRADMLRNARNINDQTIEDVRIYGENLLEQGYYYGEAGDLQGFVDGNGRWRPIDFQPVKPLAEAPSIAEAQRFHDEVFREYLNRLLDRQVEVRAVDAGEAP